MPPIPRFPGQDEPKPPIRVLTLLGNRRSFAGSTIGCIRETTRRPHDRMSAVRYSRSPGRWPLPCPVRTHTALTSAAPLSAQVRQPLAKKRSGEIREVCRHSAGP